MDLEKLEAQFLEAKAALLSLRDKAPKNEADRFCQWLIKTDINPYSLFFDSGSAAACLSLEGLYGVCLGIRHALLDDGAISFLAVNDEPVIVMVHPSDFESRDAFLTFIRDHDEKDVLRGETTYQILDIFPDEFIAARERYETGRIKSCFLSDAEIHGLDFSVAQYKQKPRFDSKWIEEFKSKTFKDW